METTTFRALKRGECFRWVYNEQANGSTYRKVGATRYVGTGAYKASYDCRDTRPDGEVVRMLADVGAG